MALLFTSKVLTQRASAQRGQGSDRSFHQSRASVCCFLPFFLNAQSEWNKKSRMETGGIMKEENERGEWWIIERNISLLLIYPLFLHIHYSPLILSIPPPALFPALYSHFHSPFFELFSFPPLIFLCYFLNFFSLSLYSNRFPHSFSSLCFSVLSFLSCHYFTSISILLSRPSSCCLSFLPLLLLFLPSFLHPSVWSWFAPSILLSLLPSLFSPPSLPPLHPASFLPPSLLSVLHLPLFQLYLLFLHLPPLFSLHLSLFFPRWSIYPLFIPRS